MRILPRLNDAVNEEWISDKTRQIVDGLKTKRLDRPSCARERQIARGVLDSGVRGHRGQDQTDAARPDRGNRWRPLLVEEMFALRLLMQKPRRHVARLPAGWRETRSGVGRASYLFIHGRGIDQADGLLIIGSNPRKESPVLNARYPQALVERRSHRRHRRKSRSHL